jgi:hypothetical protein
MGVGLASGVAATFDVASEPKSDALLVVLAILALGLVLYFVDAPPKSTRTGN